MSFSINILSFLLQVIYKLDRNERCKAIRQKGLIKCMDVIDFKFEYLRYICIISGCDYLARLPDCNNQSNTPVNQSTNQTLTSNTSTQRTARKFKFLVNNSEERSKNRVESSIKVIRELLS